MLGYNYAMMIIIRNIYTVTHISCQSECAVDLNYGLEHLEASSVLLMLNLKCCHSSVLEVSFAVGFFYILILFEKMEAE